MSVRLKPKFRCLSTIIYRSIDKHVQVLSMFEDDAGVRSMFGKMVFNPSLKIFMTDVVMKNWLPSITKTVVAAKELISYNVKSVLYYLLRATVEDSQWKQSSHPISSFLGSFHVHTKKQLTLLPPSNMFHFTSQTWVIFIHFAIFSFCTMTNRLYFNSC